MDFQTIREYVQLEHIGPICSAILVLYGLWRKVLRPLSIIIKEDIHERLERQEKHDKLIENVDWITAQLKPNGSSSIKDSLNRLENEVHIISQRQRLQHQDSPQAIFETDKDGECIYVNRTYCKMVGKAFNEMIQRGWINVLHESTRNKVIDEWQYAVADKREFDLDYNLKDEDGHPISVHCIASPMYDKNKLISGWSGVIVKI